VSFGWNDLGTWSALYENSPKNSDGNVAQNCNVLAYNSSGNIFAVRGDKLIAVSGLKDYIIADAGDVLLVCPMSEEQRIKQMVNDAKLSFGDKFL
jgi:mannose-1-phosphate guanylyltransferase